MSHTNYEPLVSIVIPAYNASNYLGEAIDSALAQTYKNIEIIVVNDGSKDDGATAEVAKRYGDKIRYFEKTNGGSSSAMNVGIRNMSGDWFSWLSHDDLYLPSKVQHEIEYLNELLNSGIDQSDLYKHIIFAAANLIDGSGKLIHIESKKALSKTDKKINCERGALNLIAIPTQDGFHGCSCLVHKEAFDEVGLFDEKLRLLNDCDLWFRFYSNGFKIHFLPEVLVCGRVHNKQVSRTIGFSYHNSEQDMFWYRSLKWICDNRPSDYVMFHNYAKTACKKTRFSEGNIAYKHAVQLNPRRAVLLCVEKWTCIVYAHVRTFGKKIYLFLNR